MSAALRVMADDRANLTLQPAQPPTKYGHRETR